jgi:hypothetical protein
MKKVYISIATEPPGHTGPNSRWTHRWLWLGHRCSMITQTTWWMLVATREQMQQCKERSCRVAWRFATCARQRRGKKHLVWGSMTSPSSSSGSGVLPRAYHPPRRLHSQLWTAVSGSSSLGHPSLPKHVRSARPLEGQAGSSRPYAHAKTTSSCLTKPTQEIIKLANYQNIEQHIKHTTNIKITRSPLALSN